MTVQVRILSSLPCFRGRTGVARPAFGRGRWHVRLDGNDALTRTDLLFNSGEFEVLG